MNWRRVSVGLACAIACVVAVGCAARSSSVTVPDPIATPADKAPTSDGSASSPVPPGTGSAPSKVPDPLNPADVRLVPLDPQLAPGVKLEYPGGWQVDASLVGDMVQIHRNPLFIMVLSHQLGQARPPLNVEEETSKVSPGATGIHIKQIQVDGTVSAFEVQYTAQEGGTSMDEILIDLYGKTYNEALWLKAPSDVFPAWEPVFRKVIASYRHSNLDAMPIGGRP